MNWSPKHASEITLAAKLSVAISGKTYVLINGKTFCRVTGSRRAAAAFHANPALGATAGARPSPAESSLEER